MDFREKMFLWILPIIVTFLSSVISQDVCTKCKCNTGERPSVSCRGAGITTVPQGLQPTLKFLDLSDNTITRIKENDLQNLESLETLMIESSGIEYIHPRAFRNLYQIQVINLQKNKITSIPASLFQHMSRLKELNLNGNSIRYISRYAFLTLQNIQKRQVDSNVNVKVKIIERVNSRLTLQVKLSGNPVHCGCDILALSHWMTERNTDQDSFLEIDDLKCHNNKDLSFLDMSDADFDCDEEEPSVFEDDLRCTRCEGGSDAECNATASVEECDHEDEESICSNTVTLKNEQLIVKKGCTSYRGCLMLERLNPINCTYSGTSDTSLHCSYCCLGQLCDLPNVGGRLKDYKFFMEMTFREGVYEESLGDETSQEYIKLRKQVELAVKDALGIEIGGLFHVRNVKFGAPGLNVYFQLSSKMFLQLDTEELLKKIKDFIGKAMDRDSLLTKLNVSGYKLTTEDTKFCKSNLLNTSKGSFFWPQTSVGKIIYIRCPHSPERARILLQAHRACSELSGEAIWMDQNLDQCPYASEMTRRLEDLSRTEVTTDNMLNVSRELQHLLSEAKRFSHEDVKFSVTIVERLVGVTSFGSSREVVNNTLSSVSFVFGAPSDVLIESEQRQQSTTRLLKTVDLISNTVSLSAGDLVLVQPNLAIAAVGVDPADFPGVSFITGSSDPQGGSLTGGEVEVKKGNTSVTGETKSAIFLPASMFSSLNPQGANRVTFTIYPTDKIFSVVERSRQGPTANPTGRGAEPTGSAAPSGIDPTGSSSPAAGGPGPVTDGSGVGTTRMINSRIIAATVPNVVVTNLKDPVIINLPHIRKNAVNSTCVYWKKTASGGEWSSEGCTVQKYVADQYTTCACDHLTNFALLMDVYNGGSNISEEDKLALSIISYIGCGISLMCLIFTLITYLMFRKLRRDNPSKILVNLCIALAIANLIFLVGMQDYAFADPVACKVVAVLLHYFLLSALTWMAVEAFYMYLALVLVFKTYFTNFILKCCTIGWGVPLIIVAITLGVNSTENYGLLDSGICWIRNPAFYIAFLAPVAAILLLNFAAFGLVLRQLLGLTSRKLNKSDQTSTATQLRGAVGVVILLGLAWIFAVFAIGRASPVFYYLFAITNSLQGLFIFIFYCLFKKDALSAWRRKLPCCEVVDEKSGDRTSSRERMNQAQAYSNPSSNNTVKHTISSQNGSTSSSGQVNMRGDAYKISQDSGFESGEHNGVDYRTSTSI